MTSNKTSLDDLNWLDTLNFPFMTDPKLVDITGRVTTDRSERGFILQETEFSIYVQYLSLEKNRVIKRPQGTDWIKKNQFDTQLALKDSLWSLLPDEVTKHILKPLLTYSTVTCLSLVCKSWFSHIHHEDSTRTALVPKDLRVSWTDCDVRSVIQAKLRGESNDPFRREEEADYILAWLAAKNGMTQEAATLIQHCRVHIKVSIPNRILWLIVVDMGKLDIPLERLLNELKAVQQIYPEDSNSRHFAELHEYISIIERMIVEEAEHNERMKGKRFEDLAEDEQTDELIYQLRTQNGYQFCQPGSCNLLADRRQNNPLKQLIERGYPVIPKLIPHVEDKTLTRSVGFHRAFYFSHIVLRVGDCCVKAISEITNKTFYTRATTNSYASSEDKLSGIKIEIERWWQEYFSKGKKQMSMEQVLAFKDNESAATAKQFVEEFPDDVLELFSIVFDGRDCPTAEPLFEVLAGVEPESQQINALLLKEFTYRPTIVKAVACLERKNFDLTPVNNYVLGQLSNGPPYNDFYLVVDYIMVADLKAGIRLLIDSASDIRNNAYLDVCSAILSGRLLSWNLKSKKIQYPKECAEIFYKLLHVTLRRHQNKEMRMCDEVAHLIAKNRKTKAFAFDRFVSETNRDRQIARISHNLHEENGDVSEVHAMDIDDSVEVKVEEIPLTQVYTLLCKYIEHKKIESDKYLSYENDIKAYGFKILSTIEKFIAQSHDKEDKGIIKALAKTISLRIQNVTVIGSVDSVLDSLLTPLHHMHDFDLDVVINVADRIATSSEYPVYIQFSRYKDQQGVNIRVEIGARKGKITRIDIEMIINNITRLEHVVISQASYLKTTDTNKYKEAIDTNTIFVGFVSLDHFN